MCFCIHVGYLEGEMCMRRMERRPQAILLKLLNRDSHFISTDTLIIILVIGQTAAEEHTVGQNNPL